MWNPTLRQQGRDTIDTSTSTLSAGLAARLNLVFDWITRQHERSLSRRRLMAMNDEQLKDIGLSRSTAFTEAQRHFWE